MTYWLSKPIETFFGDRTKTTKFVDVLIVGSGYGAAMAALALAEEDENKPKKPSIWVFERGSEYVPGDFPKTIDDLPGYVSVVSNGRRQGAKDSLWDIRVGKGVTTVAGSGLGGTSLVNANVAMPPTTESFDNFPGSNVEWEKNLQSSVDKVKEILEVTKHPDPSSLAKYKSLQTLAKSMGAEAKLADIAVNFTGGRNKSQVWQNHCRNSGNCVTGCNIGAKNTLDMNAWPRAHQYGVELYTGATVEYLDFNSKRIHPWKVHTTATRDPELELGVFAKVVILAAGTLGSTEILKRSTKKRNGTDPLKLSSQWRKRFSTNGDAFVFGCGQRNEVHCNAKKPSTKPGQHSGRSPAGPTIHGQRWGPRVGPTIVGFAKVKLDHDRARNTVTLEDGAIPYPLLDIWQELLVTQSFLRRYTGSRISAWHQKNKKKHDYLAISKSLADHSQVFLSMGMDQPNGELDFTDKGDIVTPSWPDPQAGEFVTPSWPEAKSEGDIFQALHERLTQVEKDGFDGGQYLPSPWWKLFPDRFSGVVGGADAVRSQVVTVHPLGGCAMGANPGMGVVNRFGQVFDARYQTDAAGNTVMLHEDGETKTTKKVPRHAPNGKDGNFVYKGLYVLDGSIFPGPVGTNPFLTIAALSYYLAGKFARTDYRNIVGSRPGAFALPVRPEGTGVWLQQPEDREVSAVLRERLIAKFDYSDDPGRPRPPNDRKALARALGQKEDIFEEAVGIVVDVEFDFDDVNDWREKPGEPLTARAKLYRIDANFIHTISNDIHIHPSNLICEFGKVLDKNSGKESGEGTITFAWDEPSNFWQSISRTVSAWIRFAFYRGGEVWEGIKDKLKGSPSGSSQQGFGEMLKGYWRVGRLHADWRRLNYDFATKDESTTMKGAKRLGYAIGKPDIWTALLSVPVKFAYGSGKNRRSTKVELHIDLVRFAKGPAPIQVTKSPSTPATVMAMIGFGAYCLRAFMQTHFWSFGAASYSKYKTKDALAEERLEKPPEPFVYRDPSGANLYKAIASRYEKDDKLTRLMRFEPAERHRDASRDAVLLVHGLAHSSRVFWTDAIEPNFVQYLLGRGFDVWVIDHRTSANYIKEVDPKHTWDDIATEDIPWAVDRIFNVINHGCDGVARPARRVRVFAHCIGAGAFSMAILNGAFSYEEIDNAGKTQSKSKIESFALHAVTPWLFASLHNRARGNVFSLFKEHDFFGRVDPIPHKKSNFLEIIYDRIASSLPHDPCQWRWYGRDKRGPGFPRVTYFRYTVFWGRQWNHANITRKIQKYFAGMIGAVPIEVIRQVYYSIARGRLTNREGTNVYVLEDKFNKHWTFPTFFVHGTKNEVFDIESTRLSAHFLGRLRLRKVINRKFAGEDSGDNEGPLHEKIKEFVYKYSSKKEVWIKIFKDYGHMDVIFGKNAAEEVHKHIADFFESTLATRVVEKIAQPRSHAWPASSTITGPIISRPVVSRPDGEKCKLRMWAESTDYSTSDPVELQVRSAGKMVWVGEAAVLQRGPQQELVVSRIAPTEKKVNWRSQFWLGDLEFEGPLNVPVYASVRYKSNATMIKPPDPEPVEARNVGPEAAHDGSDRGSSHGGKDREMNWHEMPWFKRVFQGPGEAAGSLSFLIGSCLHPGVTFERRLSDEVFRSMWPHIHGGAALAGEHARKSVQGVDHLLLVGDQIYADATAEVFDPTTPYERYRSRYRQAFQGPHFAKVVSHVPTYFAIDDHEIHDNWAGPPEGSASESYTQSEDYVVGCEEAWFFQMHHNPKWELKKPKLWYDFESAGFPFFVFDTRTERHAVDDRPGPDEKPQPRSRREALMKPPKEKGGACQWNDFIEWLKIQEDRNAGILFIVSGSPIAPIPRDVKPFRELTQNSDTLLGYPGFLADLIDILSPYQAKTKCTIVWLSGDAHLSSAAEIKMKHEEPEGHIETIDLLHVGASGLFAPIPFINLNPEQYDWEGKSTDIVLNGPRIEISAKQYFMSNAKQHFLRFDLISNGAKPEIRIRAFDAKGEQIEKTYIYPL